SYGDRGRPHCRQYESSGLSGVLQFGHGSTAIVGSSGAGRTGRAVDEAFDFRIAQNIRIASAVSPVMRIARTGTVSPAVREESVGNIGNTESMCTNRGLIKS